MQDALLSGMDITRNSQTPQSEPQSVEQRRRGKPRLRLADRSQVGMHLCSIDELVAIDQQRLIKGDERLIKGDVAL
jgi:hypothetical protein